MNASETSPEYEPREGEKSFLTAELDELMEANPAWGYSLEATSDPLSDYSYTALALQARPEHENQLTAWLEAQGLDGWYGIKELSEPVLKAVGPDGLGQTMLRFPTLTWVKNHGLFEVELIRPTSKEQVESCLETITEILKDRNFPFLGDQAVS